MSGGFGRLMSAASNVTMRSEGRPVYEERRWVSASPPTVDRNRTEASWHGAPNRAAREHCQANQREAASHVVARAAVEPHAVALLACDNPEAIVLDFMQPQVAGGQLVGFCGKARRDESGREGAL